MNIVNKLTVRHLLQNRGRTLITVIGIMLSVAMVCAVAGFVMSVRDVIYRTTIEGKGDYHIAYHGVTPETAEQIAAEDAFGAYFTKESEGTELVTLYVRLQSPGRNYMEVASGIAAGYEIQGMSANVELLALEGVIAQDSVMMMFITIAAIAIVIIVIGSVIVIANAFYISSSERVRQFGLLKSAGATKSQIGRSIFFEAFLLAAIAIPLGIALGFLIQAAVLYMTNGLLVELNKINNNSLNFRVVFHPLILYVSVAVSAVTMLISAWLPARRAAKISPIDAIRQTKDVRIRSKQLKTSRLTQKLFGFEGTLAAKSLKRSKTKYRATVISLTVSIVLFISMSSLVWALNKGVDMEYGGYDFDVFMMTSENIDEAIEMERQLNTIPDGKLNRFQYLFGAFAELPDGFLTEEAAEYYRTVHEAEPPFETYIRLISCPDSEFAKTALSNENELTGILINTSGKVSVGGKHVEFTPFNYTSEITLSLGMADKAPDGSLEIRLTDALDEIPASIPSAFYDGERVNILLPESVFRELAGNNSYTWDVRTVFTVATADPDAFSDSARELLPDERKISVNNVSQMTRMNRNLTLVIMLFGYGFIAMLSLIAVTSVVATISTGMALRKQEFAMLRSVGMTPDGMNKMLNLESLMYGIKSLAIGLPIGVALSYLIHRAMANTIVFAYQLPITAVFISVAAITILTFCTMRYSREKLRRGSIVEAIRSETS